MLTMTTTMATERGQGAREDMTRTLYRPYRERKGKEGTVHCKTWPSVSGRSGKDDRAYNLHGHSSWYVVLAKGTQHDSVVQIPILVVEMLQYCWTQAREVDIVPSYLNPL